MQKSQILLTGGRKFLEFKRNLEKNTKPSLKGVLLRATASSFQAKGTDVNDEQNRTMYKSCRAQRVEQKKSWRKLITQRLILKRRE